MKKLPTHAYIKRQHSLKPQPVLELPNLWSNNGPCIGPTYTVRSGNWKLIYYYENGKKELYNITNDIGDKTNLTEPNPKLAKKLSKELGSYLRKVKAQRPNFKATGKPCP